MSRERGREREREKEKERERERERESESWKTDLAIGYCPRHAGRALLSKPLLSESRLAAAWYT